MHARSTLQSNLILENQYNDHEPSSPQSTLSISRPFVSWGSSLLNVRSPPFWPFILFYSNPRFFSDKIECFEPKGKLEMAHLWPNRIVNCYFLFVMCLGLSADFLESQVTLKRLLMYPGSKVLSAPFSPRDTSWYIVDNSRWVEFNLAVDTSRMTGFAKRVS
jgi:hypothetical protein